MIPLKQIHIPTPCHASWEAMEGDAQTRFCAGCRQHVHNLSEMTRAEAQAVLAAEHVCVRFVPDADGQPLTREPSPSPVSAVPAFTTRGPRRLAAAASWAAAVLMAGLGLGAVPANAAAKPSQAASPAPAPKKPSMRYRLGQFVLPKPKSAPRLGPAMPPVIPASTRGRPRTRPFRAGRGPCRTTRPRPR